MDVKFIPLYGAQGREAMSCLLKLGDFTILLDCGWSDPYDPAVLQPLTAVLNTVDAGKYSTVSQ